jgi:beta-glucanase (GH16 family)
MKKLMLGIFPLMILSACSKSGGTGTEDLPNFVPITQAPKTYTFDTSIAWADEFDNSGAPDPAKWLYDVGGGGWGNSELQYYTNTTNNASVAGGMLTITAKKESMGGMGYTSSRMVTKFSSDMMYGRVEIKMKLPAGRGTWPAAWMLPNDYAYGAWPNSGEIDIMEHVGFDMNNVHFSTHDQANYGGNSKTSTLNIATATTAFHLYRMDWTPLAIKGYYDDQLVFTYANDGKSQFATWPFDKPFHILLNLAVGGTWGGTQGVDDTIFPVVMQVDYVRFYKMITSP